MLINAERFIELVATYRLCHIDGRFGGGKTALAVRLFPEFARRGYRMISNTACVWSDSTDDIQMDEAGMLHAYIMLDEGGLYFAEKDDAKELVSYAAKMDLVYVLPSFEQPHRRLKVITVQPVKNWRSIGLPLTMYQYRLKSGMAEDKGTFFWYGVDEIYGVYSRQDPGEDTDYLMKWLNNQKNAYRRLYGRSEMRSSRAINLTSIDPAYLASIGPGAVPLEVSTMERQRRAINELSDLADEIEESAEYERNSIKTILKGTSKRRGRY